MILAVLSALAGPTRLAAMRLLDDGRAPCVCDLMRRLDVTQSRMSRHAQAPERAGPLVDRRDAQWGRYPSRADLPTCVTPPLAAAMVEEVMA